MTSVQIETIASVWTECPFLEIYEKKGEEITKLLKGGK